MVRDRAELSADALRAEWSDDLKNDRRRGVRNLRAQAGEKDGDNPRFDELNERSERENKRGWKQDQLLQNAAAVIEAELCSDVHAIDWGVRLESAEMRGGGSSIRIGVVWDARVDEDVVCAWLVSRQGAMRGALATSLRRKRVPVVVLYAIGRVSREGEGS